MSPKIEETASNVTLHALWEKPPINVAYEDVENALMLRVDCEDVEEALMIACFWRSKINEGETSGYGWPLAVVDAEDNIIVSNAKLTAYLMDTELTAYLMDKAERKRAEAAKNPGYFHV